VSEKRGVLIGGSCYYRVVRTIRDTEELKALAGQEIGVSDWLVVTQPMIAEFAELTRDPQWIHVDMERAARESPFGVTIAHGFLTLSLVSHLFRQTVAIETGQRMNINYGFNRLRFVSPVRAGARIRLRISPVKVKDVEGGIECTWNLFVECEDSEKPAIVAEWLTRMYY
jgi:acyl dehydratase